VTDSTKSTRHQSSSPWSLVTSHSHARLSQDEIKKALERREIELILECRQYVSKKQNEKDLGPFKFNQAMLVSFYNFLGSFLSNDFQLHIGTRSHANTRMCTKLWTPLSVGRDRGHLLSQCVLIACTFLLDA
jgi:hypothetical protein